MNSHRNSWPHAVGSASPSEPPGAREPGRFVGDGQHAVVAVVVVTYNSAADIDALIADLRTAAGELPIRLIVVDNQSGDDTLGVVRKHSDIVAVDAGGNLGYAGGINTALPLIGDSDFFLILNPDLRLSHNAIATMVAAAGGDGVGAVVPLIMDDDGAVSYSLCREPSIMRALGAALLGSKLRSRPAFCAESVYEATSYRTAHDVDWATGAAVLVPAPVISELGRWDEDYFQYSEEVEYFRRIRMSGRRIRFEPAAVVRHLGEGSGSSPALASLRTVNRVRYIEKYHGRAYSALFRAAVALGEGLRSYDFVHRQGFLAVAQRRRWQDLPRASIPAPPHNLSGNIRRGAVIIPACNEGAVIGRTLEPLSQAAVDGFIELIVVCNGCTDDTAEVARSVAGVRVLELEQGSKPAALNAGDAAALNWPRLYLDADVQISAESVVAVLDRLTEPDVLAASPDSRYDSRAATALVRSYYRAKDRISRHKSTMWSAGAYGLSEAGHSRFGEFPTVTGDDLFVDTRFEAAEKTIVVCAPSVRRTPANAASLLAILRRHHRGVTELSARERGSNSNVRDGGVHTAVEVVKSIRGPRSAMDAAAYLGMALAARSSYRGTRVWERDDSSRTRV